jgi:hypothetical protein
MDRTLKEFLWGKTKVFEASDVQEGVEIAHQLKADGKYDWFRGQVCDWPPHGSFLRLGVTGDDTQIQRTRRRIFMFAQWAQCMAELQYLMQPEAVHDFFAILQHYGVPTYYIDFTTDPGVAGFFAADTKSPPRERRSCIYCLNTKNLVETWNDAKKLEKRADTQIELITIDVRNLWRLQAQHGTFVYTNYKWEIDYPLDRIVFPYTDYPTYPTREMIYPEHKSPLEQLLDQYFSLERATFTTDHMREMVQHARARGGHAALTFARAFESGYYPRAFADVAQLTQLASWSREALQAWNTDPHESFHETAGHIVRLKLGQCLIGEELRKAVSFGVKQVLRSDPAVRLRAIDWEFDDLLQGLDASCLNSFCRPAWNGMRRLPYSDDEIADAFGAIVILVIEHFGLANQPEGDRQRFSKWFGESVWVEFGYEDGSGSRGCVSRATLDLALRPGIGTLLTAKEQWRAGDIKELFKVIYNPSLMFEFEVLKRAFAQEIIPAQVVLERSPILFNPARLKTFGNP